GRLEDMANPYLGFTTIFSLGVGAATFSLLGWQSSSRKLNQAEEKIAALKQQLQEKEALLEHLKFSETRLQAAGLNLFLEPETVMSQSAPMPSLKVQPAQAERQPHTFPNTSNNHQTESQIALVANQKLPMQSFVQDAHNLHDTTQIEGLLAHLKQVMSQIEKLQTSQTHKAV
ncbi:MAG TPA: hypothetical protein V6C57_03640, partial [Coleofasciculaceae cyanobacterium]